MSCDREKEFLSQRGILFTAKDIQEDPAALDELHWLGYRATPVTFVDGEVVVGFDRGKLERLLGLSSLTPREDLVS
ncbi:MAG: glutaredoxin family protein [Candidatus Rokubacteria bacterium]|nr:glutaredoxin family protein [Candidatus Rokubacteria bacterium]